MNATMIQLLILAAIAVFLILRLKSVLGTREGFEKPPVPRSESAMGNRPEFEVIEGGPDRDIVDHVPENSDAATALAAMKRVEPSFGVSDFLQGARGAYEMIVMGYENGELAQIEPFLAEDIYESFVNGVAAREDAGLTIEAEFIGVREVTLADARFDEANNMAELTLRFVGELTSVVRDKDGEIVEGHPTEVKRQKDSWIFARVMGTDDPNWRLIDTDA